MKMKKIFTVAMVGCMLASAMTGCSGKQEATPEVKPSAEQNTDTAQEEPATEPTLSGTITVLTNKTDTVDTKFVEYAKKFNEKYPDVKVEFEAMADYEGQVKIRLNTEEYGDVLLIPNDVTVDKMDQFLEPLGSTEELSTKYFAAGEAAYHGTTYGLPVGVNIQTGFVYNKKAFENAGITELPTTPEQFLSDMQKIKDTGIIPLYTNYAAGWTLNQWENTTYGVDGNVNYKLDLINSKELFVPGKGHYDVYKLMYDVVAQGLVEADPFTTDWEMSKQMCADGQVAVLPVGSWALSQVKGIAANPDDIGFMPLPITRDGKVYAQLGPDYKIGINKHSKNIEAAKAWVEFFLNESGFAEDEGMIAPLVGQELPEDYKAFEDLGVQLIVAEPVPDEFAGKFEAIDQESEVGVWAEGFKQRMVEAAFGNRQETFEDIVNDLNAKWGAAQAEVMQ